MSDITLSISNGTCVVVGATGPSANVVASQGGQILQGPQGPSGATGSFSGYFNGNATITGGAYALNAHVSNGIFVGADGPFVPLTLTINGQQYTFLGL